MKVVLQQGHVPRKRGSTGAPGEQDYARAVTADITDNAAALLRAAGHRARVIGADQRVPRSDAFVAVHYDGSTNSSAKGASVGYRNSRSRALAHAWKRAYDRAGHRWGFRSDNYTPALARYYGTGRAHRAGTPRAIIIEGGFGSHPREGAWLRSREGARACAEAIFEATTGDQVDQEDELADTIKKGDKGAHITVLRWRINQALHQGDHDPRGRGKNYGLEMGSNFDDQVERYVKHIQGQWGYPTTGELRWWEGLRLDRVAIDQRDKRRAS